MNNPVLLSVVTVTKNCQATLYRTLQSVAQIKLPQIEYIVIDGDSTDGTLSLLHGAGDLIDILISEPDTGIYNAMNKGVMLAGGEYIVFLNGDDQFLEDGFAAVMKTLAQRNSSIICAKTLVGDKTFPQEVLAARPWRLPFFNSIPHPSSFVRRELLIRNPFREDLRIVSDYDFFLGQYLAGESFCVLPVVTALHQRGGASGDVLRSQNELDMVQRERLGWRYPLIKSVAFLYRQYKRAIDGRLL